MAKVIISEGKTTNEAIENGLKELKTTRNNVEIKILEQEKRSFFDILAPRVVKVELTLKEEYSPKNNKDEKNIKNPTKNIVSKEDLEIVSNSLSKFLDEFLGKIDQSFSYSVNIENSNILVSIEGKESGTLIGYRGDTLNAMQFILNSIANKGNNSRIKVYLNIDNYKEKREKALEELAVKVSKTVLRNGKAITLEPMSAYERKIIHNKLQDVQYIRTHSVGEEPNRRIIIEKVNR